MNRIYKIIWRDPLAFWIIASKLEKGSKKKGKKKSFTHLLIIGFFLFTVIFDGDAAPIKRTAANGALVVSGGNSIGPQRTPDPANETDATNSYGNYEVTSDPAGFYAGIGLGLKSQGFWASVAIGDDVRANARYGVAIGSASYIDYRSTTDTDADRGVKFGDKSTFGPSMNAISIGSSTSVKNSHSGISIGSSASVSESGSGVSIGHKATLNNATVGIAIGYETSAQEAYSGIVIGNEAKAEKARASIAMGLSSSVKNSVSSVGIGEAASINESRSSVSLGHKANLNNAIAGIAIGYDASAQESNSGISIGNTARTEKARASIAMGPSSSVKNSTSSVAIGDAAALEDAAGSIAIGYASSVRNSSSGIGIGNIASVNNAENSVAIGLNTKVDGFKDSVALGSGSIVTQSNTVSIGTPTTPRKLVNVAKGDIKNGGTDAVNAAQVFTLQAEVNKNANNIRTHRSEITDGRIGLVQQDTGTKAITVAAASAGNQVSLAGSAGERTLTGIQAGAVNIGSTDAINGSQLFSANTAINAAIDSNLKKIEANSVEITKNMARSKINSDTMLENAKQIRLAVTDIEKNAEVVEGLATDIKKGAIGLMQKDQATGAITVAAADAGEQVSFTGTAGNRKLTGVKEGDLTAASTDAVNGNQLFTTNERVTANSKGIAENANKVKSNTGSISILKTQINNGGIGLMQRDMSSQEISVAASHAGDQVSFAGTAGARTLTG
ncbi:hypothetical protein Rin_00008730, partial [Candidatus Regiella insecticola 5.15]